jgi:putative protease
MPKLKSELLVPAGSLQKLKVAVHYGADAIYIGTPDLSLRVKSAITLEDLIEGVEYAHKHNVKVYLTLNLFTHNNDIEKLPKFVETINTVKPDGVIIADPGVFEYIKNKAPEVELHLSTQANISSWLSVKYWKDQGAALCVLARETSFQELKEIREKCPDIKLETFIHGAMCMTYSGRCLLSNFMAERGANQGNCAHSCRWNYKLHMRMRDGTIQELEINEDNMDMFEFLLEEEIRPGELMPIEEDSRGSYILNAKDLCLLPKLDQYLEIGIDSLKVEGRNKSEYYVALVTRAYRMAMDDWQKDPENWDYKKYMGDLDALANRGYSLAFHDGRLSNLAHNYDSARSASEWEFAGMITEICDDSVIIEVKNRLTAGDVLEFVPPAPNSPLLLRCYDYTMLPRKEDGEEEQVEVVNPGFKPKIRIFFSSFEQEEQEQVKKSLQLYTVLRKEKAMTKEEVARLKLDLEARRLEKGEGSQKRYKEKQDTLQHEIEEGAKDKIFKTPRIGVEGCCGRGCNGCLMFWQDDKYKKARELLQKKKAGELLSKEEAIL